MKEQKRAITVGALVSHNRYYPNMEGRVIKITKHRKNGPFKGKTSVHVDYGFGSLPQVFWIDDLRTDLLLQNDMQRNAEFSPCRCHRYTLRRIWDEAVPCVQFIGLNPSTADETTDDATIRRCIGFARTWGYGGLVMTNLFAYRATDPREMIQSSDPIGALNNNKLITTAATAGMVIAAWGAHGNYLNRAQAVTELLANTVNHELFCLGLTNDGYPRHPLRLAKTTQPVRYAW